MKLTEARGTLMAIGGAEDREGECYILNEFAKLAKGKNARIVVMTTATEKPKEMGEIYTKAFHKLGVKEVRVVDVSSRADAMAEEHIKAVEHATGLFFTGGNQLHVTSLMGGTNLQAAIHARYEKDLVIGGTSAGAAMMSNSMILNGASDENPRLGCVSMGAGMDLIVGCIIDTHFSQRGRHGRLLAAVAHYPQDVGFGIDENTAFIVKNNQFEVIGEGAVTVIDAGAMTYTNTPYVQKGKSLTLGDVKIHVLSEGHKFDLKKRELIIPARTQHKAKRAGADENSKTKKK
jgi:cyanophycinase